MRKQSNVEFVEWIWMWMHCQYIARFVDSAARDRNRSRRCVEAEDCQAKGKDSLQPLPLIGRRAKRIDTCGRLSSELMMFGSHRGVAWRGSNAMQRRQPLPWAPFALCEALQSTGDMNICHSWLISVNFLSLFSFHRPLWFVILTASCLIYSGKLAIVLATCCCSKIRFIQHSSISMRL